MRHPSSTVKDVALHAGVSTATVSRVLNEDGHVTGPTRERVLAAVEELGYKVNTVARSLKTRSTRTVGIMAPDLSGDFFMYIAESIDRELTTHGYSLVVTSTRDSLAEEAGRVRHLAERLVDGIIVIPVADTGRHFESMLKMNIPIVFIDRTVNDFPADAVLADNEGGAYEATRSLIADGIRRIGFIGGKPEISTSVERLAGFKRAMDEAGLGVEEEFIRAGPPTLPFGYRAMEEMVKRGDSPDAWFLVNGFTHVGATNYLITKGAAKGRRMVFAAFDEMPYAPLMRFCRYSIQQPMAEMGRTAAKLILERISGQGSPEPRTIRLKTRLIRHRIEP